MFPSMLYNMNSPKVTKERREKNKIITSDEEK